jgi:hypothetical protein
VLALLGACHSSPTPIVPIYPDADAACVVDQRITDQRLIRSADGTPLSIPCVEAGVESSESIDHRFGRDP